MKHVIARLAIVMSAVAVTSAHAQQEAVSCVDLNVPITGVTEDTQLSLSFTAADLVAQCTSSTGSTLSLVTPTDGVSIATEANKTKTVTFTVSDASGNTATANVIVTRN